MKIGLFGGTFNPPHLTHVNIARQAVKQLSLDKLLIVPCGIPPHKRCDVDKFVRLKMCQLAFGDVANAEVWDYEIEKEGKSYTVETLREVKKRCPDCELYLIIGGDSLNNFDKWYSPAEIAALATLVVADRSIHNEHAIKLAETQYNAEIISLDVEPNDVSSTEIRLRYQFGFPNADLVPKAVDDYVLSNNLYAEYRNMALKLRNYLPPERLKHTFYVVKRGLEFATDEEYDDVFVACLLHDCAKYLTEKDYARYLFAEPKGMPKPVVHSFFGAYVANVDFGIDNDRGGKYGDVLSAITFHTTGRPNMSRLEKIVYVADKTEQTRPYPLEHLLSGTLDEIFLKCLFEANEYREQAHGDSDYWLTDWTLKYYKGESPITIEDITDRSENKK